MIGRALAANVLWAGSSLRSWRRFRTALEVPCESQWRLLSGYLSANRETKFGRAHGFGGLRSVADYQSAVPVRDYDALAPFFERVAAGEPDVLTDAPVERLTPSSGSTSAVKLIPSTRVLRQEFSRAVDAWIADLYLTRPRLMAGPAYWSITPAGFARGIDDPSVAKARSSSQRALPVGFEDDTHYLAGTRQALARAVLAVPASVAKIGDLDAFRRETLLFLLRARQLRLISVWHPSFLSLLLDELRTNWAGLIDDLSQIDRRRAEELRARPSGDLAGLWPKLSLISCWTDGPARPYARALALRLPGVTLQPKGLVATEAIVTIPFAGAHPLAVRSHFFEFLDPSGGVRHAHDLERGVEYRVVVTTGGGLYRYSLGDRVIVDAYVGRTPSLRFVGKDDRVSDQFGEKLSDGFVGGVLTSLFVSAPSPRFAMLAPQETTTGTSYTLFVEPSGPLPGGLSQALERGLRRNPHYAWCVDVGQLLPARVRRVGPDADRAYVAFCVANGQQLGNVKPVSLHTRPGWEGVLPCSPA